ncbi:MAG: flagellar basal body rod protein FlgC [Alphaproteobacteria bacterium]|nr:flagellar basal body rod protein FlgC [Alphaproteobacteria bacterium]
MSSNELTDIFSISGSALQAQDQRMKIIAQNIANAGTSPAAPGQKPYQRQVIAFKNVFDKTVGAYKVEAAGVRSDTTPFVKKYDPSNPAADKKGYVLMPNVKPLVEMMDMNEASRSYQANLDVIAASRTMASRTIALLQ